LYDGIGNSDIRDWSATMWLLMWAFFAIAVITSFVLWCALRLNRQLDDFEEFAMKRTSCSDDQRRAG
jgi:hypothetical protein